MPKSKKFEKPIRKQLIPETTPEGREQQLIGLAMDCVERRLMEGTASATETVHFLKLASSHTKLEEEKLRHENAMLEAKTKAIESLEENRKLMIKALNAMRDYRGFDPELGEEDDFE